jgi:phosphoenolpyruvate carboxylase
MLEEWSIHDGQRKVYRRLYNDFSRLRAALKPFDPPDSRIGDKAATHIPEFSSRHEIANRRIFQRVLQLDIPAAVGNLRRIFPATPELVADSDFGEPASYVSDASQTYQRENDQIFTPMLKLYDLIPRISIAIVHYIGAIG